MFRRRCFTEEGPELTPGERARAIRLAKRAAGESRGSLTLTARKQYRRYRAAVGERFMAWKEWEGHYRSNYGGRRAPFSLNYREGAGYGLSAMLR